MLIVFGSRSALLELLYLGASVDSRQLGVLLRYTSKQGIAPDSEFCRPISSADTHSA